MTAAALLAPLSVLATWANGQIQETDRYLETVGPLASDPDVQDAIAARVEQVIFSYLDLDAAVDEVVEALEGQGLPQRAAATLGAPPARSRPGSASFVSDRIEEFVAVGRLRAGLDRGQPDGPSQLVAALRGDTGGAVESTTAPSA